MRLTLGLLALRGGASRAYAEAISLNPHGCDVAGEGDVKALAVVVGVHADEAVGETSVQAARAGETALARVDADLDARQAALREQGLELGEQPAHRRAVARPAGDRRLLEAVVRLEVQVEVHQK